MTESEIRKELEETLRNDPNDYNRILELSSLLASFDENNVRFSIDAGVIDRLGKELVARHETAVSELVKNAYDADATYVELLFENTDDVGGTLIIEDDGHGMTRDQLIKGFMRISSTDKVHSPQSPKYKRSRAGKKGIGRFATQRLGQKLTITTQTADSEKALQIVIDWKTFEIDKDLIIISNSIKEVEKEREYGTTLQIENLREWWSIAMMKRVYRYSLEIIQPFPLAKKKKSSKEDPGFVIRCFRSVNGDLEDVADEDSMIYDHALATIEGQVDANGKGIVKIDSSKLNFREAHEIGKNKEDKSLPFDHLKSIRFKAYYFIYNIGMIPKMSEGYIREKANEVGGIRLYRNGFRVLPYGEPKDDWLGLDESVRRRVILPSHGRNNFFGFVEIIDPNGEVFNELSSREGLFQNRAHHELVDFTYRAIITSVLRIAEVRSKKKSTSQKDWVKEEKTPSETVTDIADKLDEIADNQESNQSDEDSASSESGSPNESSSSGDLREISEKLRQAAESIKEIGMLRVLAGLGLTIGEFTHEIKQYLPAFDVDSTYLVDHLSDKTEEYRRAVRLKESFTSFNTYASYFDETISQNVQRELRPIELRDAVNRFVSVINPDLERNGCTIEKAFDGFDLFSCKMHPSEWASILFNLYSNSKKAIKRAKSVGSISIKAGTKDDNVYLEFSDNGDGIPEENREKIFRAFFTTSNQVGHSAKKAEELTGTGLGLKIINDIIEGYGGEISLENAHNNFTTKFRIEVPKATDEEIEEYDV